MAANNEKPTDKNDQDVKEEVKSDVENAIRNVASMRRGGPRDQEPDRPK